MKIENADSVEIDVHRWYARIVVVQGGIESIYHIGTTPGNGIYGPTPGEFDSDSDYPKGY